jgi:hypothetical protein
MWSDPETWTSKKVPVDGDHVTINSDMSVVIDVAETAKLGRLEVNGHLSFKEDMTAKLRAHLIFVRRGKLISGSATKRTPSGITHTVELFGERDDVTLYFDPNIEPGNKVLAVTGQLEMFGAEKTAWVRLTADVEKGATTLQVEQVENWTTGEKIAIAPSTFNKDEYEIRMISNIHIDKQNNRYTIPLDKPLDYFHAGTQLTVDNRTIDVRAAVGNLTRNVRIIGSEANGSGHNCNVMVTEFDDYSSGTAITRSGSATLDNVEFTDCGQGDSVRAGLRFEKSKTKSYVRNSVIYDSDTFALSIDGAENVDAINNVMVENWWHGVLV